MPQCRGMLAAAVIRHHALCEGSTVTVTVTTVAKNSGSGLRPIDGLDHQDRTACWRHHAGHRQCCTVQPGCHSKLNAAPAG